MLPVGRNTFEAGKLLDMNAQPWPPTASGSAEESSSSVSMMYRDERVGPEEVCTLPQDVHVDPFSQVRQVGAIALNSVPRVGLDEEAVEALELSLETTAVLLDADDER